MEQKTFWITTGHHCPHGDMIYACQSGLRIRVSRLTHPGWAPAPYEVQLYGNIGAELLVFETIDIQPDDALDMAAAVRRYADYYGEPEMIIFTTEPHRANYYVPGRSHTL